MNARLVFACVLSGAGLVLAGGGVASAEDPIGSIWFTDTVVEPETAIQIVADCGDHTMEPPRITSEVLGPISHGEGWVKLEDGWHLNSDFPVLPDAAAGVWPVSFTCGGELVSKDLRVGEKPEAAASIEVEPGLVRPGQKVVVAARCVRPDFTSSTVESPALVVADLARPAHDPVGATFRAEGRVRRSVPPGIYEVSFTCVDRKVSGTFRVTAPEPEPVAQVEEQEPQVPVKPQGAPETGSLASESSPAGLAVGLGAVLLGVGGLGAAAVARRRRA